MTPEEIAQEISDMRLGVEASFAVANLCDKIAGELEENYAKLQGDYEFIENSRDKYKKLYEEHKQRGVLAP